MSIDRKLLDILACPQCKGDLKLQREQQILCCPRCRLAFPIRDNIPILLVDEASAWDAEAR